MGTQRTNCAVKVLSDSLISFATVFQLLFHLSVILIADNHDVKKLN